VVPGPSCRAVVGWTRIAVWCGWLLCESSAPRGYEPSAVITERRDPGRPASAAVEQALPKSALVGREQVGVPAATEGDSQMLDELGQRLTRRRGGRGRLAAHAGTKRALRGGQAAPEPVSTRQAQPATRHEQPCSPTRQPAEHGCREREERQRRNHEARDHRGQLHRESPATASSSVTIRAENPTAAYHELRAAF